MSANLFNNIITFIENNPTNNMRTNCIVYNQRGIFKIKNACKKCV